MMHNPKLLLCVMLLLAACSGGEVNETLGLNRRAPDEFVVVSRPPLVVPPDFDLSPPRPGEDSPHAVSTEEQARALLLGSGKKPLPPGRSPADADGTMTMDAFMAADSDAPAVETAVVPVVVADPLTSASANFLKRLGAEEADPAIRTELAKERVAPPPVKEADSLYEQMLGAEQQETIVDSAAEAERLRANKDAGKPVTEGETPTKDETPQSVLDKVF
jgi:hypothetical protein